MARRLTSVGLRVLFGTCCLCAGSSLGLAQDAQLVVPPALRSGDVPLAQAPAASPKKIKKRHVATAAKPEPAAAALPQRTKATAAQQGGVDLDVKWRANNGSGGNSGAGTYNPWAYQGDVGSSQVQGSLKFGF